MCNVTKVTDLEIIGLGEAWKRANCMLFLQTRSHTHLHTHTHTPHTHTHTHILVACLCGDPFIFYRLSGAVCRVFNTRKLVFNPLTGDQIVHNYVIFNLLTGGRVLPPIHNFFFIDRTGSIFKICIEYIKTCFKM